MFEVVAFVTKNSLLANCEMGSLLGLACEFGCTDDESDDGE